MSRFQRESNRSTGESTVATRPVRINVSLSEDAYETLKSQSKDLGMDMSAFVRNALQVYNTLQQEQLRGKKIYIGTSDKIEKELVLPS